MPNRIIGACSVRLYNKLSNINSYELRHYGPVGPRRLEVNKWSSFLRQNAIRLLREELYRYGFQASYYRRTLPKDIYRTWLRYTLQTWRSRIYEFSYMHGLCEGGIEIDFARAFPSRLAATIDAAKRKFLIAKNADITAIGF